MCIVSIQRLAVQSSMSSNIIVCDVLFVQSSMSSIIVCDVLFAKKGEIASCNLPSEVRKISLHKNASRINRANTRDDNRLMTSGRIFDEMPGNTGRSSCTRYTTFTSWHQPKDKKISNL
uniref:Uncharacterized protein n=1 Tax=Oryza punctata TaxID=4537 RepID=A0A0E0K6V6_ORYPU